MCSPRAYGWGCKKVCCPHIQNYFDYFYIYILYYSNAKTIHAEIDTHVNQEEFVRLQISWRIFLDNHLNNFKHAKTTMHKNGCLSLSKYDCKEYIPAPSVGALVIISKLRNVLGSWIVQSVQLCNARQKVSNQFKCPVTRLVQTLQSVKPEMASGWADCLGLLCSAGMFSRGFYWFNIK